MNDDRGPYPEPSVPQIDRRSEMMGGYPAELRDAVFPTRSANQVVVTCRRIVSMLQTDMDARRDSFPPLDDWKGGHRTTFNERWATQSDAITRFWERLQTLIGDIDRGFDAVQTFNRNQAARREEYDLAQQAESEE